MTSDPLNQQNNERFISLSSRLEFYCPSTGVYKNAIILGDVDNDPYHVIIIFFLIHLLIN